MGKGNLLESREEIRKLLKALPSELKDSLFLERLDSLNKSITRLTHSIELTVPRGIVENRSKAVTATVGNAMIVTCFSPWFSFSLYNDGPDGVYVLVEGSEMGVDPHLVRCAGVYEVDMHNPKIKALYLWVDSGARANVRISGLR